jgi:hypothetical protein
MPIYESETTTREDLFELRRRNRCQVCGGRLNVFLDADKHLAYLACNTDQSHEGIVREAWPLFEPNIPTRRKIMEQQFGAERSRALERYHGVTALSKEQAKEILKTVYPNAPETEMMRAVLLCASYHLNPLMGHVFLIPFKGKEGTSWATVVGIKAKRLVASRNHAYSYVDDTPRLMNEEEQIKVFGKVDTEHLVAITILQDPHTGATARGYGKWGKSETVYGTDKGNSQENMAFIRSESQALDRLAPGEMPIDVEVVDEQFVAGAIKGGVIEDEVGDITEPDVANTRPESTVSKSAPSDLKELKDMMKLCNWSAKDFGQFCVSKNWKIKVYEDLKPEQITEAIDYISKDPK